jgi:GNAT superfamily N-acetyltransferase
LLRIKDISEENLEDVLMICSGNRLFASVDDPILEKGRELKGQWLLNMLERRGSCMKVAYLDEKPVAQILFYPEETMPYLHNPRKDVIYSKCIYISSPEARGKGVGSSLLKNLINECHTGLDCLGGRSCRFVVTRPFPHEGDLPLGDFYEKSGFKQGNQEMFLEINGKYVPQKIPSLRPLREDRGKIIATYNPDCEWGYFYAATNREIFQGRYPVEIFNSWEKPEEYRKRGGGWMLIAVGILVNSKVPENPFAFWTDRQAFIRNVEEALRK